MGSGEICLNSIDCDGTMQGYDLDLMNLVEKELTIPLIASGGAGKPKHLKDLFEKTHTQGVIISSMLYSSRTNRNYSVAELKKYLYENNIHIRPHEE